MSTNKKRIAKNTVMLYFRMILVMAATLFTTRIVLKNLGVEDYGIYNVVAGLISMFSFLNSSMAGATQRFLSFELGINDAQRINMVFCQSVIIHFLIALIIFILAETIGLWFVYNKLTIPEERFDAAMWVYQIAIFSFLLHVVNVPYHAAIIAHEKMNIYAWVSILDVSLKLGVAYAISISPADKLITYSLLILSTSIVMFLFYWLYCKCSFPECHFRLVFEKGKFLEMFSFAGWNIIGNMANAFRMQGSNILLNMFFGPAVNAARGVAHQVDGAVAHFVTNFQTASNPQIVKTFALKEYEASVRLVCQCSKFSFYLMLLIGLPVFFQAEYILSLWLTEVPPFTVIFVKLILFNGILDALSRAIIVYIKATGNIKWYMIIQGGFYLLVLPVIYVFLKLGYSPVSSMIIILVFTFLGTFLRLFVVNKIDRHFSVIKYTKMVLWPATVVGCVTFVFSSLFSNFYTTSNIIQLVINTFVILLFVATSLWFLGVERSEKSYIVSLIAKFHYKGK